MNIKPVFRTLMLVGLLILILFSQDKIGLIFLILAFLLMRRLVGVGSVSKEYWRYLAGPLLFGFARAAQIVLSQVGGEAGTGKGGLAFDVFTPISTKVGSVYLGISRKNNQAPNIIVNIKNNPNFTAEQIGNQGFILNQVRSIIEPQGKKMNIVYVKVIE